MSSWWNFTQKSELIANYNDMIATCKKLQDNLVKIKTLQQTMLDRRERVIKKKHFTS
jgi:hypothetical protein